MDQMNFGVLFAIRPKWCDKILDGEKTIEVRKTRPKLALPFRGYIYCTKPKYEHEDFFVVNAGTDKANDFYGGGRIIAEFTCNRIAEYIQVGCSLRDKEYCEIRDNMTHRIDFAPMCLSPQEFDEYGKGKPLYGLQISDLIIYNEPKELHEFYKLKAPQSWCYVKAIA